MMLAGDLSRFQVKVLESHCAFIYHFRLSLISHTGAVARLKHLRKPLLNVCVQKKKKP